MSQFFLFIWKLVYWNLKYNSKLILHGVLNVGLNTFMLYAQSGHCALRLNYYDNKEYFNDKWVQQLILYHSSLLNLE